MSRKVQQRKGDDSPLILAGAAIFALVAIYFGYPGFVLLPIGVTIAAFMASPPELTDKKNGRPIPADDHETAKLRKYRSRQSLKSTFFNPEAWWPGAEVRLSWFVFLSFSIIVGMIPVGFDHFGIFSDYEIADHIFGLINAIAVFITITAYDDASRRFASDDEPRPAVGVKDLRSALPKTLKITAEVPDFVKIIAAHGLQVIVVAIYVGVGFVATIAVGFGLRIVAAIWESFVGHSLTTYGLPTLAFAACGGIGLMLMVIASVVRPRVIGGWRLREAARAEWKPRWADLKFDPAPALIDRRQLSAGLIDTFQAPAGKGAMTFIDKEADIIPALGAGQSAAVIESPQVDALGQKVEGSIHPNEFRVVQIPADSVPDAFDAEADAEITHLSAILAWKPRWASLKFKPAPRLISREIVGAFAVDTFDAPQGRSATEFMTTHAAKVTPTLGAGVSGAILSIADQNGVHPTQFRVVASKTEQALSITDPSMGDEELSIALESAIATVCNDAQYARPDIATIVALHDESSPVAAWYVGLSIDPGIVRHMRLKGGLQSQFAAKLGCVAALNDNPERMGGLALYVGAFDDDKLSPNDSGRQMLPEVAGVREEDWWNGKWMTALDSKINAPFPIPDTPQQDATLVDGATLHRRFFSILNNERVSDYLSPKIEEPLSVALSSALAGVTGYMERSGNDFNQHNQVIVVQWADRSKPVPKSPAYLRPQVRSSKVSAEDWLLKLMINQAFDAAKLTRPGVTSTAPLSSPNADDGSHLWRVNMTLLGGVTTDVIRKHLPRMKERLSIPWATVFKDTSGTNTTGVSLVMGAHPEHVSLGNEKRDRPLLVDLEWQKAFAEANVVSASTGEVPALVSTHTLEYNDKVRSTTFTLPGMDLAKPRAAIGKLTSATGNAFLQVSPDPTSPQQFILLSSRTDPMPDNVGFPFQSPIAGKDQVFGVGIDGRPNGVDWSSTPHLLIVGGSGSGKSVFAQSVMYGAFSAGHSVVLIDAQKHGADFQFARKYSSAFCTTVDEARAVMESIYAEVERRAALNGHYGVSSFDELPETVRPKRMIVFIDEFLGLVSTGSRPPSKPESDPKAEEARLAAERSYMSKRRLAFLVGRVAAEARSAGINLSLMTQKMTAKSLPDDLSDLKTNLGRVALGKMSYGDKMSALRDPDSAPSLGEIVPRGRLVWESVTAPAIALQGYFSPTDEYGQSLASFMGDPATIECIDFTEHLPDNSSDVIEGRVLVADEAEPTEVDDDLLLDLELAEIDDVSEGDIPDWAKDFTAETGETGEAEVPLDHDDDTPTLDLDDVADRGLSDSEATSTNETQEAAGSEEDDADIDWDSFFSDADGEDTEIADEPEADEGAPAEGATDQQASGRDPVSVEDAETLVFLDIDGCLAPFGGSARRGQMTIEPAEGSYGDSMVVDPRIMKAVATIDAPIVWSSAREVEDADVLAEHIGWPELPAVDTATNGPGPHEWFKTNAIVAFLDEVPFAARIVVIDDDEPVAELGSVLAEAGYDHLIIQPDSAKGLTRDHVAEINAFLAGGSDDTDEAEPEPSAARPEKIRRAARPAKRPRRAAAASRLPSDDEF
ncbi:hypothetical protein GCM10009689_17190 [Brevibacterium antiquum]|uniref:FtsK/SpoIIIE domain-containing protein n=1 Tax=Brevibacterium antiquum TaxID=234835 RepID=UPI0018E04A1F|nr:FtsK/SpoIIIE domain-containing protein [Brevibacterium antiquum]